MAGVLHLLRPSSHGLLLVPVIAGAGAAYLLLSRLLGISAATRLMDRVRPSLPPPGQRPPRAP